MTAITKKTTNLPDAVRVRTSAQGAELRKETEKRLYALVVLKARVKELKEELFELESMGIDALKKHSASFVRLIRPGMRISEEEAHEAQLLSIKSHLVADEREVSKLTNALKFVEDDPYYGVIESKYFSGRSDEETAQALCCDPATVRRNRMRLLKKIMLYLYGTQGLN